MLQWSAGLALSAAGGALGAATQPMDRWPSTQSFSPANDKMRHFGSRGVPTHDPSRIVRCEGVYWVFSTGRGGGSRFSTDFVNWQIAPRVFRDGPDWISQAVPGWQYDKGLWAPDLVRRGDDYRLYYSASSFGKNTSAIGLATAKSLNHDSPHFGWTDHGSVMVSTREDPFNAIDPCPLLDADGRCWMSFGSFWDGIKLIELDAATGKRIALDSPMYSIARAREVEGSFIFRRGEMYYLIVNWGLCCRGLESTYSFRIGRAKTITGPYLDKDGRDMASGGGSLLLATDGPFIGPGQAGVFEEADRWWLSMHFYDGTTARGTPRLAIRQLLWNNGWPNVASADPVGQSPQPK
jgi:arabinan endo-1,5-alpha-L-arabinosidase